MIVRQPTPEEAADIIAINHLAASYSEAVSRGEIEEAAQVYAPDGVLRSGTTDDVVGPSAIAALQDSAHQLGRLLDSSRQLVTAISEGYLGRTPELFGVARGFEVREVRPMGEVRLGLAFLAWGVLGSFALGAMLFFYHRATSLTRSVRRS